jgi:Lhr-like helicase
MQLNDQQKEFYNALENTYRTPGWNLMVQGWTTERDSLSEMVFHNAKSMDDIFAARVRYALLNELIGLAQHHESVREQIENTDEDEMHNV